MTLHESKHASSKIPAVDRALLSSSSHALSQLFFEHTHLVAPSYRRMLAAMPVESGCGAKFDNIELVAKTLTPTLAKVPLRFSYSDDEIKSLLSPMIFKDWHALQLRASNVSKRDIQGLQERVDAEIRAADLSHNSKINEILSALLNKVLIVRSSSDEDTVESVNAGLYDTVDGVIATKENLQHALAQVVGSYFNLRSLRNGTLGCMPKCSVLIMEQIRTEKTDAQPIVSGVMMTHKTMWSPQSEGRVIHIAATWGFGRGVVSGHMVSDEWVLTDAFDYPTIREKQSRYESTHGHAAHEVINPAELRNTPCLTHQQIDVLRETAAHLEHVFGLPMNVEFVVKNNQLYIVQARPFSVPELSKTTYINPDDIPTVVEQYKGATLISGESKVMTLKKSTILFAKTLEEAEESFCSKMHQAILIYDPPKAANTHAEVNFVSHRPPIPCLVLSEESWQMAKETQRYDWKEKLIYSLCPQTGLFMCSERPMPIQTGLFLHPAKLSVSFSNAGKNLTRRTLSPMLVNLKALLRCTPIQLMKNLPQIKQEIEQIFADITRRLGHTEHTRTVQKIMHKACLDIYWAMREAAEDGHVTHLSLHASGLSALLDQRVSHSISGLDMATYLPDNIVSYIESNQHSTYHTELAMLGKHAFDSMRQSTWLRFLEHCPSAHVESLLQHVRRLADLDMLGLWFALHLSEDNFDEAAILGDIANDVLFLEQCALFTTELSRLQQQLDHLVSSEQFEHNITDLLHLSQQFIIFVQTNLRKSHDSVLSLQTLHRSKITVDLINLWDLHVKTVCTSRLYTDVYDERKMVRKYIKQFADFGCALPPINYAASDAVMLLEELGDKKPRHLSRSSKRFSVQHWLYPANRASSINTEDQRLTAIHQNMLQLAGLSMSEKTLTVLPTELAQSVSIFNKHGSIQAKRFGERALSTISITPNNAEVRINIPLNYHSFVLNMRQDKGCHTIEVTGYWRASDNDQGRNYPFLAVFASMTGVMIKHHRMKDGDLEVVFSIVGDEQMRLLSLAIGQVNLMTLHSFASVVDFWSVLVCGSMEEADIEENTLAAEKKIFEHLWQGYQSTGELPPYHMEYKYEFMEYLNESGHMASVVHDFIDCLRGSRPYSSVYANILGKFCIKHVPKEQQISLIIENLSGPQTIAVLEIPRQVRTDCLEQFFQTHPQKAQALFKQESTCQLSVKYFPVCYCNAQKALDSKWQEGFIEAIVNSDSCSNAGNQTAQNVEHSKISLNRG